MPQRLRPSAGFLFCKLQDSMNVPCKLPIHRACCGGVAERGIYGNNSFMSVAELPIVIDREKIAEFCRARGIRKLSLFGSVLRDNFDPQRSDIDVLAEFVLGVSPGLKFFGYGDELAEIIGRKVDFNTEAWLSKYFREEVLREALPVYEQT